MQIPKDCPSDTQRSYKNKEIAADSLAGIDYLLPDFHSPLQQCPRCPEPSSSCRKVQTPAGCQEAPSGNSVMNTRSTVMMSHLFREMIKCDTCGIEKGRTLQNTPECYSFQCNVLKCTEQYTNYYYYA